MTRTAILGLCLGLAGCALKSDVRRVEAQLRTIRTEAARTDSVRAAALDSLAAGLIEMERRLARALEEQQRVLGSFQGELRTELLGVQQQLVQIQELTGQSQQRLSELRAQIERRSQSPPDTGGGGAPGAAEMFDASMQQLRRGATTTARTGFLQFLATYPTHERAPDALFYVGESFEREGPDSAVAYYEQVVKRYPDAPRAPQALYKLGLLAEQRGETAAARVYFERVVRGYPGSPEASLAREKLPSREP